jgi:hypothetical protein
LKARIDALNELKSSYDDLGPVLEVVVFHDGNDWRAVVAGAEGEGDDDQVPIAPPSEKEKPVLDLTGSFVLFPFPSSIGSDQLKTRMERFEAYDGLQEGATFRAVRHKGSSHLLRKHPR